MSQPDRLSIDPGAYAQQVEVQRNEALNQVAQLRGVLADVLAERDRLRDENAQLREQLDSSDTAE